MTTSDEFRALIEKPEGIHVEFKSASGGFHFDEMVKYCVALANEGGGMIVFGVTDGRPRRAVVRRFRRRAQGGPMTPMTRGGLSAIARWIARACNSGAIRGFHEPLGRLGKGGIA